MSAAFQRECESQVAAGQVAGLESRQQTREETAKDEAQGLELFDGKFQIDGFGKGARLKDGQGGFARFSVGQGDQSQYLGTEA